jgi:hypothetical protein
VRLLVRSGVTSAAAGVTRHVDLGRHQPHGERSHHLPRQIAAVRLEVLAQPLQRVHVAGDHRVDFLSDRLCGFLEDDAVVVASGGPSSYRPGPYTTLKLADQRGQPRSDTLRSRWAIVNAKRSMGHGHRLQAVRAGSLSWGRRAARARSGRSRQRASRCQRLACIWHRDGCPPVVPGTGDWGVTDFTPRRGGRCVRSLTVAAWTREWPTTRPGGGAGELV